MIPRFTEFYIPVLEVLSDLRNREINELIESVATYAGLSKQQKLIKTRSGNNLRYKSNISWAITDLTQGGFIERPQRGVYTITFEGLQLLEDKPTSLDREVLAKVSDKFRAFLNREGSRRQKDDASITHTFGKRDEDITSDVSLTELYQTLAVLKRANLSTTEIESKIANIENEIRIRKYVSDVVTSLNSIVERFGSSQAISFTYVPNQSLVMRIGENVYQYGIPMMECDRTVRNMLADKSTAHINSDVDSKDKTQKIIGKEEVVELHSRDMVVYEEVSSDEKEKVEKYVTLLESLKSFNFLGVTGPHKPILLLAIFEFVHYGLIRDNKIFYTPELEQRYIALWKLLMKKPASLGAPYPFAHLSKERFIITKFNKYVNNFDITWNTTSLRAIEYLSLDRQLFELLKKRYVYTRLSKCLTERYCGINNYKVVDSHPNSIDREKEFRQYLVKIQSGRGTGYASSSIGVYIGALKSRYMMEKIEKINPEGNLFLVDDISFLQTLWPFIENSIKKKEIQPAIKSALKLYIDFLNSHLN